MTATDAPASPADLQAARAELIGAVFDGTFDHAHKDIRELLLSDVFDAREGLSLPEAGRLAYQRSRFVHGQLERPLQILANPLRLFALAEWPALLDVATFSLLMVHYNLCLGSLVDHGQGRPELAEYFEDLDGLACFGPYMATELGFGNNVAALRTEAVWQPAEDCFVLNTPDPLAQKYMSYSGFTDIPKIAVVMARLKVDGTDRGVFPFVVRLTDQNGLLPGIRAVPCPEKPVQGLDNGLTWFDHVRLPRHSLLYSDLAEFTEEGQLRLASGNARKRFLRAMSRIQPGRLCVSSSAVGAGKAACYLALRFAEHRLTNAPGRNDLPIGEYRSHQLALYTALAKVYAMVMLLNRAKREFLDSDGTISAELNNLISITKALSTWEMTEVIAVCRERCGAQGIFSVNRIADYGSLLQGLVTAEGDNQVLLATTAGQLLAQRGEPAAVVRPELSGRDLTELSWVPAAFGYREQVLLAEGRRRMAESDSYFEGWNWAMNGSLAMARLRGVRIALESLVAAAGQLQTGQARDGLELLAGLYAVTELQRDAGWYLAHGVLSAEQVLGLADRADALCAELAPHVPTLIEGFALSPELLRAPIAAEDYAGAFIDYAAATAGTVS